MDVVVKATPHGPGDAEIIRRRKRNEACCRACVFLPVCCLISLCIVAAMEYYSVDAQYSVATGSVSGLRGGGGLTFNLTLRVASQSDGAEACINPGMYVEVFYRGIRVAATEAAQTLLRRTCAWPRSVAELPVVATATALPVGQGLDTLAAEMKEGAAVFDFVLHVPARSYGGDSATKAWVTVCKGSRIGGDAVLCDSPNQNP